MASRRARSRFSSSLSATCRVEKATSTRLRPSPPDRAFRSRARQLSTSSSFSRDRGWSTSAMISFSGLT